LVPIAFFESLGNLLQEIADKITGAPKKKGVGQAYNPHSVVDEDPEFLSGAYNPNAVVYDDPSFGQAYNPNAVVHDDSSFGLLEKLFGKKKKGVGQAPIVKDPWGVKTSNFPISVRKEVEWEEELERIHQEYAPYSKRYMRPGFGSHYVTVSLYRVDNLVTGLPRWPTYAIPYKDRWGKVQLAKAPKHPHLAVEEFKKVYKQGHVVKPLSDFNHRLFGYGNHMLISRNSIEV